MWENGILAVLSRNSCSIVQLAGANLCCNFMAQNIDNSKFPRLPTQYLLPLRHLLFFNQETCLDSCA